MKTGENETKELVHWTVNFGPAEVGMEAQRSGFAKSKLTTARLGLFFLCMSEERQRVWKHVQLGCNSMII